MRTFQHYKYRTFRACLFAGLGLWGIVPGVHAALKFGSAPAMQKAFTLDILMGITYLVSDPIANCQMVDPNLFITFDLEILKVNLENSKLKSTRVYENVLSFFRLCPLGMSMILPHSTSSSQCFSTPYSGILSTWLMVISLDNLGLPFAGAAPRLLEILIVLHVCLLFVCRRVRHCTHAGCQSDGNRGLSTYYSIVTRFST